MRIVTTRGYLVALLWGSVMSAAQNGAPPGTPNATIYRRCTASNTVALTFDDGPYIYETDVVNTLAQYGAKGTFFFNGNNYACIYDDVRVNAIKNLYNAGHQIGGHTWDHADLTTLSWDKIHDEMWKVEQAILRITGAYIAMFRPPYGDLNQLALQAIKIRNQSAVLWDFDSEDSVGASAATSKALYDKLAASRPASILALNHSPLEPTVHDVLPHALSVLSGAGYRFVTVSECLGAVPPYQYTQAPSPRDSTWHC